MKVQKSIYFLTLLFSNISSFPQVKIDDIKNDKDAAKFVEEYGKKPEWGRIGTGKWNKWSLNKGDINYIDSL